MSVGLTSKDTLESLQEFTVEETTERNMVEGIKTLSVGSGGRAVGFL